MRKILLLIIPLLFLPIFSIAQSGSFTSKQIGNKDVFQKNDIKIYPNPAFNFIGLNEISSVNTIIIYNLVGRKMKNFIAEKGKKYFIADLPKGMYLVQLLGRDGKVVTTQRMSKR